MPYVLDCLRKRWTGGVMSLAPEEPQSLHRLPATQENSKYLESRGIAEA